MIIASIILGFSIIAAAIIKIYPEIKKNNAAMACLTDLVDSLNKEFPGSTLTVTSTIGTVTVSGILKKYIVNNENN